MWFYFLYLDLFVRLDGFHGLVLVQDRVFQGLQELSLELVDLLNVPEKVVDFRLGHEGLFLQRLEV